MLKHDVVEALVEARHDDPFAVLGMHRHKDGLWVSTVQPGATRVAVVDASSGRELANLSPIHADGIFEGCIPRRRKRFAYRLRVAWQDVVADIEDPYRFPPVLGDMDVWLLAEGKHTRLYEILGAHSLCLQDVDGIGFAVWAPNAGRVAIVGDFNHWDGRRHPMRRRRECGVWELFIPGLRSGSHYKFEIKAADGTLLPLKADPFAFASELRPGTASIIYSAPRTQQDMDTAFRPPSAARDQPMSIYEVHAGSWRREHR